jgi:tetratricopeptide (TPR) repeat protein
VPNESNELPPVLPGASSNTSNEVEPSSTRAILDSAPEALPYVAEAEAAPAPEIEPLIAKADSDGELIGPTGVRIKAVEGVTPEGRGPCKAALTERAIWLQATWQCKRISIQSVHSIEANRKKTKLNLVLGTETEPKLLELKFERREDGEIWLLKLEAQRAKLASQGPGTETSPPEGVALLANNSEVRHTPLGRVRFTDTSKRRADRGLQLRAALLGADAVFDVQRRRVPGEGPGARDVCGLAVRVEDGADRQQLREQWYSQDLSRLFWTMLAVIFCQFVVFSVVLFFLPGAAGFPSTDTPLQRLLELLLGGAEFYLWPLLMLILLRVLKWPGLLQVAALAFVTITTLRALVVFIVHLCAMPMESPNQLTPARWVLFDPFDWFLVIFGMVLTVRVLRLRADSAFILRGSNLMKAHPVLPRVMLGVTGLYAIAALGFVGYARYEASSYMLQPGVNTQREQQGLTTINTGNSRYQAGDLPGADLAFNESLRIWEELTKNPSAPATYRQNLALCLINLGWIAGRQKREDDAERIMKRALAIADNLAGQVPPDDFFDQDVDRIRRYLAATENVKAAKVLDEKDKIASRKYDDGVIKADQKNPEAEGLFREAIALWEEVLPQAQNPEYRAHANAVLADVYAALSRCLLAKSKLQEAESTYKRSVDYLEIVASLSPERPLLQHELERARERLDFLGEYVQEQEVEKLLKVERFADARDLMVRGIEQQEKRMSNEKERAAATRLLASRLSQLAYFLIHCPSQGVRDAKEAVKASRRATLLDPKSSSHWFTYALTLYRTNDWSNSLTALDELKVKQGEWGPVDYFLMAMNQHQLKRLDQAKASFRKGVDCWEENVRQAEGNPEARVELERQRPSVEGMRQEAEELIKGKIGV